jgi:hypothetical protein
VDNLERRLSYNTSDGSVLDALSELTSPKSIRTITSGDDHEHEQSSQLSGLVDAVCTLYGAKQTQFCRPDGEEIIQHHSAIMSKENLLSDMFKVKSLVDKCYTKLDSAAFIECILTEHADDLPFYSTMCKLPLCVPVTSVECERAFGLQNRIKTKVRNRLGEKRVNLIMTINTGPSIDNFDFASAVRHWRSEKKRRLSALYRPAKKLNYSSLKLLCR